MGFEMNVYILHVFVVQLAQVILLRALKEGQEDERVFLGFF